MELGDPQLALAQIRSEGRLLVDDHVALEFAGRMWGYARRQHRPDLEGVARTLYLQAKPVSAIFGGEEVATRGSQERTDAVRAWSEVATRFERPSAVGVEIRGLVFGAGGDGYEADPAATKSWLMLSALETALDASWHVAECRALVEGIGTLGSPGAHFWALWALAEAGGTELPRDALDSARAAAEASDERDLAYACFLEGCGEETRAVEVVRRLQHIRIAEHRRRRGGWKFSDVAYSVTLRRLQEALGVPEGPVPGVADPGEEAYARVERTARQVGRLFALAKSGEVAGDRSELLRSLLLFHNRPVRFGAVKQQERFVLHASRWEIYEQVMELARAMGRGGIEVLRDVVGELVSGPSARQFWPQQRRDFGEFFYREGVMTREQAMDLGLSSTADATEEDPRERQEGCFKIGAFLRRIGAQAGSEEWKGRATEVSAGAGSHKDYHMARVAQWLARSVREVDAPRLAAVERFARAVEIAGGDGTSEAVATVLQLVLRLAPGMAWRLAIEQIDRDVVGVWGALEALITGGRSVGADPELLSAVYGELFTLIAPGDTSEAAVSVLRRFPRGRRREVARRLMLYVRTNALPSCRAAVGRALEDAIRADGLEPVAVTQDLGPGRDDSARGNGLYRLGTGRLATVREMSERLGDPRKEDTWNPNPNENRGFDWWSAIREAQIEDEGHLEQLIAAFPPPDYGEVEVLARRAEILVDTGDPGSARAAIERALGQSSAGSWDSWRDGAQKRLVFAALKRIDHAEGVGRAREEFRKDLGAGRVSSFSLADMGEVFDFLEVEWPSDAALEAVDDYVAQVLGAGSQVRPYGALSGGASSWTADQALCRFVAEMLACPVVDVGGAARRTLGRYMREGGNGLRRSRKTARQDRMAHPESTLSQND